MKLSRCPLKTKKTKGNSHHCCSPPPLMCSSHTLKQNTWWIIVELLKVYNSSQLQALWTRCITLSSSSPQNNLRKTQQRTVKMKREAGNKAGLCRKNQLLNIFLSFLLWRLSAVQLHQPALICLLGLLSSVVWKSSSSAHHLSFVFLYLTAPFLSFHFLAAPISLWLFERQRFICSTAEPELRDAESIRDRGAEFELLCSSTEVDLFYLVVSWSDGIATEPTWRQEVWLVSFRCF